MYCRYFILRNLLFSRYYYPHLTGKKIASRVAKYLWAPEYLLRIAGAKACD